MLEMCALRAIVGFTVRPHALMARHTVEIMPIVLHLNCGLDRDPLPILPLRNQTVCGEWHCLSLLPTTEVESAPHNFSVIRSIGRTCLNCLSSLTFSRKQRFRLFRRRDLARGAAYVLARNATAVRLPFLQAPKSLPIPFPYNDLCNASRSNVIENAAL